MAKNKIKKRQNDAEFAEEAVVKNVKRPAQNNPGEGANDNAKC